MNSYPPDRTAERRTFESYKRDGQKNLNAPPSAKQTNVMGVISISPFASLNAISIPDCLPFDVMHLVFLGFTRDLCRLLNGTYFTVSGLDLAGFRCRRRNGMQWVTRWPKYNRQSHGDGKDHSQTLLTTATPAISLSVSNHSRQKSSAPSLCDIYFLWYMDESTIKRIKLCNR